MGFALSESLPYKDYNNMMEKVGYLYRNRENQYPRISEDLIMLEQDLEGF